MRSKALGVLCAVCVAASGYMFSQRSVLNLNEVDPKLHQIAVCAILHSPVDFVVIDGGRTAEEHAINVSRGVSWIRRSRHQDGKAIDFAAFVDGKITYAPEHYYKIAAVFKACSADIGVPIVWGGDWKAKDLMHIELARL